jgi:hypothetical protein
MFAKMKTGTKILAGFGIAIVIAAVVGVVGWSGIATLRTSLVDVGDVRLKTVRELGDIDVAANQIKASQRTLLNLDLDMALRQRQDSTMAKSKADYQKSFQIYGAVSHTAEEAALWKSFQEAWAKWLADSEKFIALSKQYDALVDEAGKKGGVVIKDLYLANLGEAHVTAYETQSLLKIQVQEWKNILIRGNDKAAYDKHLGAFEKAETKFA